MHAQIDTHALSTENALKLILLHTLCFGEKNWMHTFVNKKTPLVTFNVLSTYSTVYCMHTCLLFMQSDTPSICLCALSHPTYLFLCLLGMFLLFWGLQPDLRDVLILKCALCSGLVRTQKYLNKIRPGRVCAKISGQHSSILPSWPHTHQHAHFFSPLLISFFFVYFLFQLPLPPYSVSALHFLCPAFI